MSMREGLAQHERLPAALAPHYIDVDELAPAQLMTLALQYAGLVRFAEAGPAAGWDRTWRDYFAGDETAVMAEILALRVPQHRAAFDALVDHALDAVAPGAEPVGREQSPTFRLRALVRRLEGWSDVLLRGGSPAGVDLGNLIAGVLATLEPSLRKALAFHDARPEWDKQADPHELLAQLATLLQLDTAPAARDDALRALYRTWFNQLAKAIEMIQRGAAARLQHSLHSGTHDPGAGLLLAFVRLYGAAQEKVNRLTEAHLDFYYDDVLRQRPRAPVRDTAFLVFERSPDGGRVRVPAGTAFLAPGTAQQADLAYLSRTPLEVGDARLCALYTLFCERNPLTAPENRLQESCQGKDKSYPTACRVARLPVPEAAAAVATAHLTPHPLFGAPRTASATAPGQAARLGFALGSNVLSLREGERAVHVVLQLGMERTADGCAASLGQRLELLARAMGESAVEVRYKVLRRMFTLSVTGPAGWIAVPGYSATFAPAGEHGAHDALHLYFTLAPEVEPVVPFDAAVHGPDGSGACPLLRVELDDDGYLYPYGLLRGLPLVRARIDATVRGHRSLILHNQLGALSPAAPFQPFGPLPERGSYLVVGSAEAACKHLTSAELVLQWNGLPRAAGGLRGWYAGYGDEPFEEVGCQVGVLADGRWQPGEMQGPPRHVLFSERLATPHYPIAPVETVLLTPVLHLGRATRPKAGQPFGWGPGATAGFFRLTLATQGDFVLGHRAYPQRLATVLTHNAHRRYRLQPLAAPNPPYTPVLESLSMNYTASATIGPTPGPDGEALLRLHPFGWEAARGGSEGGDLLLPPLDYSGNLYLGFSAGDLRATLTLFFHLVEDALPMAGRQGRNASWSYLADNKWQPLPPHAILADSTHGFLRPGIVTLALPPDIGQDNTVMPSGLYWLRVGCENDLNKFCQLYSVHPHALQVWRDLAEAAPAGPARIPAGAIRRPRSTIPGLGRLTQMTASTEGRPLEDRQQLRRRTAERLRHKGRAILPADYERLVLERFPQIDRVKCFPNLSLSRHPDGSTCPGHVLVVALPPFESRGHMAVLPRLNGDLVAQVHDYLAGRMAPGVTLEVANPFYQRIQVRCKVRLAPGVDHGWYVNLLDRLVSDHISPWSGTGNTSPFGWCIRQHDIEAALLAQDEVLGVSEFSMLSVSDAGSERYLLTDTAVPGRGGRPAPDVTPLYPWSVAVPIRRHAILVAGSEQSRIATRTGIGKLEIGSTFIIPGEAQDGKAQ
ncbi:hypothetical protein [Pseudoduganella chitinolytica]|uniref:Baseplate protein J-like domain-containing protein n=1 Tax=Pseudoduganella chitinolytica TaxID=34070 RepID=A0ABY8BIW9_9BURK|nr:hypothetical protein [Pseudoduganella chitinolytica]WEF34309.1 hypothetical protein PX653_05920 [Pseudoduganella chitinolytica]